MYIFTRRVLVNPAHVRKAMAHATALTQYVNEKSELEISLYQVLQGAPLGTLSWAFRAESYAAVMESVDAWAQSDEYLEKIESGAQYFIGNAQDELGEVIHLAGEVSGPPAVAGVVTANLDVSRAGSATAWSVQLADYTANLSGIPTAVLTSNFGSYGRISWVSYAESLAQFEEAGKKLNSDPGFIQRLGDSQGFFVPGSGVGTLARKIA